MTDFLACLIAEAPDVLCSYMDATSGFCPSSMPVSGRGSQPWADYPSVRFWTEVSRAISLAGILGDGRPRHIPPRVRRERRYGFECNGSLDASRIARAAASGFPLGLPWRRGRRDDPSPEMVLLAAALREAGAALALCVRSQSRTASLLCATVLSSFAILREAGDAIGAARHRGSIDARTAAARVLSRQGLGRGRYDPVVAAVARLYQGSNAPVALSPSPAMDFGFVTLEGEGFDDKLLELLVLARSRSWLMEASPDAKWHPARIIGGAGMPIMTACAGRTDVSLWFQSAGTLSSHWSWSGSRDPMRGIPDIVISAGNRFILVDAKNYAEASDSGPALYKMLGYRSLFGLEPFHALIVRPSAAAAMAMLRTDNAADRIILADMPVENGDRLVPDALAVLSGLQPAAADGG